jgi:hypothetical protein
VKRKTPSLIVDCCLLIAIAIAIAIGVCRPASGLSYSSAHGRRRRRRRRRRACGFYALFSENQTCGALVAPGKKLRTSVHSGKILFVGFLWIFVSVIRSFVGVSRLFVRAK